LSSACVNTSPDVARCDRLVLAGDRHDVTLPPLDVSLVSEKLSAQIVVVHSPEVLSSTAVKLSWDVRRNRHFIEGFRIKYRVAAGL